MNAKIIAWEADFCWEKVLEQIHHSPSVDFFVFINKTGKSNPELLDIYRDFHKRFPMTIAQGTFQWQFAGSEKLDPFLSLPDGALLPVGIPLNLSVPGEILSFSSHPGQFKDAFDFVMALAEISVRQLIPVKLVSRARVIYQSSDLSFPAFLKECQKLGKALRMYFERGAADGILSLAQWRAFAKDLRRPKLFSFANQASHLSTSARAQLQEGFSSEGGADSHRKPKMPGGDLLRVGCADISDFPGDRMFSRKHLQLLRQNGIEICQLKKESLPYVGFPIQILRFPSFHLEDNLSAPWFQEAAYRIVYLESLDTHQELLREEEEYDEIWISTPFRKELLEKNGISKPIHFLARGLDWSIFKPVSLSPFLFPKRFCILSIGDLSDKSDFDSLLEAYSLAFTSADPVLLVLAVMPSSEKEHVPFHLPGKNPPWPESPPVAICTLPANQQKFSLLLSSCDLFVQIRKEATSDAFALHAMACGKPVAATKFGENSNAFQSSYSYLIPTHGSNEPTVDEVKLFLCWCYAHQDDLKRKGKNARLASETWRIENTTSRIAQRLLEIADQGIYGKENGDHDEADCYSQ